MCARNSAFPGVSHIGMLADDLTGACDSGVEFLTCARHVVVEVETDCQAPAEAVEGITIYNTQSRSLPPEEAYGRAFRAARRALSTGAQLIFKKVDSALRGNFGVEIAAAMDATAAPLAFIMPAIPDAGRETIAGVQHIGGIPITESFYARDPEHPVYESSVLARAEETGSRKAGLISLEDVRAGKAAEAAARLQNQGHQLIVVDARSVGDLHSAVKSLIPYARPAVFVGCQGLAQALAAQLPALRELPCSLPRPEGPTLFVCGTLHPQSKRQLDMAAELCGVALVEVEMSHIQQRADANAAVKGLVSDCRRKLSAGHSVAIRPRVKPTESPARFSSSVLNFLSDATRRLVEAAPPSALVLTGGETAYSVCRALHISVLKLHARIAPLVVASKVVGGPCHDMIVVTKGGSIGPDDLMSRIYQSLPAGK